ncbi:MAG TPA: hypothetical protein VLR46_04880 [Candidatus Dormibacteraeota bacterium]|nr:hypothetical protein [Candidatus Dormibacteraeota bacterium]
MKLPPLALVAPSLWDMRGNLPVPSHRGGYADAALFPAVWFIRTFLRATFCGIKDLVAAGLNPAALATLVEIA